MRSWRVGGSRRNVRFFQAIGLVPRPVADILRKMEPGVWPMPPIRQQNQVYWMWMYAD